MEARVCDLKRRLDARNSAAHHQRVGIDRNFHLFQRSIFDHSGHGAGYHRLGFLRRHDLVRVNPRNLLADGSQLNQVRIQSRVLRRCAEGLLMQMRRTSRHDHARQPKFLDVFLDQFLPQT